MTLPVDDAGDEPLLAEAAHVARADLVGFAGGDLEVTRSLDIGAEW